MPDDSRSRRRSHSRSADPRYFTKVLHIDMTDNILAEVREIANERGVSLYRQIREFVQQGVREYHEDKRLAFADEDSPKTWTPDASGQESLT